MKCGRWEKYQLFLTYNMIPVSTYNMGYYWDIREKSLESSIK